MRIVIGKNIQKEIVSIQGFKSPTRHQLVYSGASFR
nr:MAG TPA: hypothetical protein [Caudoviricetes sp.]